MNVIYPAIRSAVYPAVRGALDISEKKQTPEQIIQSLFAQGQQGFWFPLTDFASLSQDSAGTLPYTAVQQPVGRVLDRSGRGNHATQVTSTARGLVSARVNLLVKSEDFTDPLWIKQGCTVVGSKLVEGMGTVTPRIEQNQIGIAGVNYTLSTVVEAGERVWVRVYEDSGGTLGAWFNLATKTVGTVLAGATASIQDLGGGRVRCSVTGGLVGSLFRTRVGISVADASTASYSGDGVSGLFVHSIDTRFTSQASLPYQRVTTPTDYDSVGFPKYLRLDGTDDFYTCGGGGSTTGFYYADVIRPMGGAGTGRFLMSDRIGGLTGYMLALTVANKLELALGGGGIYTRCTSTDSIDVGTQYFIEAFDDGVNLQVAVNGGTPVTVPRPATPTYGGSAIMLYKNTIGNDSIYNGQVTEPIYRAGPPPSAYERGVIRAYQMQKAGML